MDKVRAYSHYTTDAIVLLGKLIKLARKERKLTEQDLADRVGISRGTLKSIEKGSPTCKIGLFFEAATIVGVELFNSEKMSVAINTVSDKLTLLPKSIHNPKKDVKDDF